jgi:hypothetical protein
VARTVVVLCDVHLEYGERVEAEELPPIRIEGQGSRVLALCKEHKREYYDPFVDLVDDLGQDLPDGKEHPETKALDEEDQSPDEGQSADDPDRVVAESPAMKVVSGEPETAEWECPVDDCDKTYTASGDTRAEDLKRLGNLHLSTAHHLDKAARNEMLTA